MNREDSDGNARETSGDPPEDAGLRAAGMDDLRSQAPQEESELDDGQQIPRRDRTADVPKCDEIGSGRDGGIAQGAWAMRGHGDVVLARETLDELAHIRLSTSSLGEGDEQHDPRPRVHRACDGSVTVCA